MNKCTCTLSQVGTVYQLIITISILLAQVFGMANVLGNESGWPWLLVLTAVPAVIQLVTLPFCPESPKYLLLDKDDEVKANDGECCCHSHSSTLNVIVSPDLAAG